MNIPKSFQLGGIDWKVIWDNDKCNDREEYGLSAYSTATITMSTTYGLKELPDDRKDHTFYHELVHAILDSIHERELSSNEKFVDNFATLLHQFTKTAKYE